jgi:futalosine hydrolase
MLLLVPTELEAKPLREAGLSVEVIGFGPVEAALGAARVLSGVEGAVFLVGIGGAYPETGLRPGQLALATMEFFGDLAACYADLEGPLHLHLPVNRCCDLRDPLLEKVFVLLKERGFQVEAGPFVTVCCVSRDPERGRRLALRHSAILENMEGFAVALAAKERGIPLIELRAVSNLIEDLESPWEIEKALNQLKEALLWLKERL